MDKHAITEAVLDKLNTKLELKQALKAWWYPDYSNNRENARLTTLGFKSISKVMTPYEFEYEFMLTGQNVKQLTALKTPFFLTGQSIIIFSKPLATMIKMYPSFERYMELINE